MMHIGFIGLGLMGSSMAERLIGPDITLHVYDHDPRAMARLVDKGAISRLSASEVADIASVVFACLPNSKVSLETAKQVAKGKAVTHYVETSTIGRECIESIVGELTSAAIKVIDAPISGGPKGARKGALSVMVAGQSQAVNHVRPLLEKFGNQIFIVHESPGRAQVMKLVNNLISAAIMISTYESLVLGARAGLDPDLMVSVLNASSARNSATLQKVPDAILTGSFDFGASVRTITKDVELGIEEAKASQVPLWLGSSVLQVWRFAMTQGTAEDDYTSVIKFMEKWAGVEVRSRKEADI